jgi:hypothetical protein
MIELEFLTGVSEDVELAKRYWSIDSDGKFVHKVSSLLPYGPARTTTQLASLMRSIVIARDQRQTCPKCAKFETLTARSNFKAHVSVMRHICQACRSDEELAKRTAQETATRALQQELDELAKRKLSTRVDFQTLPDEIVLILLAVDKALSPRLAGGTFSEKDCRFVAPAMVGDFILRLIRCNAIILRPDLCAPGTFTSGNGGLRYFANKAVYQLTPAITTESPASVIMSLRQRIFDRSTALADLWLDHATADCVRYALDQSQLHSLPVDQELESQIASVVRVAAESYSVAELWNVIWKVVRDAATLSRREFSNPSRAAETLPGKIKRLLEKVRKGEVTIKHWDRPDLQPSGTLGELFDEIFGIDEHTAGSDALHILSPPNPSTAPGQAQQAERTHTDELFHAAVGHNATLEVLQKFAEAIAQGYTVTDAISYVYEAYPYLSEPF